MTVDDVIAFSVLLDDKHKLGSGPALHSVQVVAMSYDQGEWRWITVVNGLANAYN